MTRLNSIVAICAILCCLNLPIHAFNRTRSFYASTETEYLFVSSKDRIFAVNLEKNILMLIAIDGGNESNMCSLSSSPIEMSSDKKQLRSLGNGKLVISAETGKDEHQGGKVHSYIIVDPLDCSSLVGFKSFGGVVVPYHDSFDIMYWSHSLRPQRRNDKGKLMRLEKRIDKIQFEDYINVQTIRQFNDSEGYLCEGKNKLMKLDEEMEGSRNYPLKYVYQKVSMDYGRATECNRKTDTVCNLLNEYLEVNATVELNDQQKAHFHTVNNLPGGDAVVVRSTHIPDIETFHATIINADGSIGRTEDIISGTIHEPKVHAFVLSSDEFCIVVYGKNSEDGRLYSSYPKLSVFTQCVDISN